MRYLVALLALASTVFPAEPLPNTKPLTDDGDQAAAMVAGIHKYLDRELKAAPAKRETLWKPDLKSFESYVKSVEGNRERLRKSLGVIDKREKPNLEYVSSPTQPAVVAETKRYKVYAVRWAVLPGVDAEGLLLEPTGKPQANAVVVPDAGVTPEMVCNLAEGLPTSFQFARQLADAGHRVLVPTIIDRADTLSANAKLNRATNQPHREFVHRMAYEMGRTLVGYEVQKVLAALDWFTATSPELPVKLVGDGEGGRVALYAGALDDRPMATLVCRAFGVREGMHAEPLDRNVWGLLTEFGDAEVGAYLYPTHERKSPHRDIDGRVFYVGETKRVAFPGPVAAKPGRSGAAPGTLAGGEVWKSEGAEVDRARKFREPVERNIFAALTSSHTDFNDVGDTFDIVRDMGVRNQEGDKFNPKLLPDARKGFDPAARHKRQFDQLVSFTQKLWRDSDATRKDFWKKADASSPEKWEQSCDWYREYFHSEVIGKLPEPTVPLNPRSRQVYDEKTWAGYEVKLDVYDDVFASGILLLPKDLKPTDKRPVVVCQHGLEGTPRKCIEAEKGPTYFEFARKLVEQGYVVYCPQNPYYGGNTFRQIQRKANPLKLSLFSFIIRQHQRTLDFIEKLPGVDAKRIGFYGLSYGGKTAMRVPAVEKRYCLSICSGDFNEWVGKNVSVDLDRSYMWTGEYEMYEFDLGSTFNYAEMAYLIAPRPFMVERGHDDPVGTDEMVSGEYAKVRYLYANRLKLAERTAIDYQPGGHQIFLKGSQAFIEKHLGKTR